MKVNNHNNHGETSVHVLCDIRTVATWQITFIATNPPLYFWSSQICGHWASSPVPVQNTEYVHVKVQ
jgi:hypothetical protein